MLRRIIVKCNIILVIVLGLLCVGTVSHAYIPEITTEAGKTTSAGSIRYSSAVARDGVRITWEDLATKPYYWCMEHGVFLPSKKSMSRPEKDSTITVNGTDRYIAEYTTANEELGKTRGDAYSTSPYGPEGSVYETVYTTGKYSSTGTHEYTPSRAFIEYHANQYEKTTTNYPNEVQSAIWIDLERVAGQGTSIDDLNANIANAAKGRELAQAGRILEKTMKEFEQFKSANSGNTAVNQTDYSNLKIGYNKNKGTVIVGPFKLNYTFSMYKSTGTVISNLLNEDGAFEFSIIDSLKIYADDNMRKEVKNYTLIYPERGSTQDRIKLSNGNDTLYRYPLPGEEFYIEFLNSEYEDIESFERIQVTTKNMGAEGTYEKLEGKTEVINYFSKVEDVPCTSQRPIQNTNQCALHPEHQVGDGHARAYIYSLDSEVIGEIDPQIIDKPNNVNIPVQTNITTMELGEPATFMPFIFPIPIGYYRDNETEYVPVLPVDPDPNEPETPPTPENPDSDPEIKLTFDIAGTVWQDDFLGKETLANGILDAGEKGLQNIIVRLYKVTETGSELVRETLTNENGEYMFQYVRVGYDYYIDFTYDGMTYTSSKYLGTEFTQFGIGDFTGITEQYRANPDAYQNMSHAVEAITDRVAFNSKFMEISYNQALGTAGIIPLSYKTYMAEQGAVSALITTDSNYIVAEPFQITASTKTAGLYYLLDDNYIASEEDLNLTEVGEEYYYHGTYPGTLHINLGLVKRDKGDFAVKNDVYQTILTMKENIQTYKYNGKTTDILTYDPHTRLDGYYNAQYTQKIDRADYNWRYDSTYGEYADLVKNAVNETDELNVYIEYKYLIRNQSPSLLQFGAVLELVNHFDSNLEYATSYDFTNMTSWIETDMIDEEGEVYREVINWEEVRTKDGYTTISTTDLKDKVLTSGETLEIHLILKVKKDANRNIIMDLGEEEFKENVLEIARYTFNEGLIDRDSNPGNVVINTVETYEDDSDIAPLVKLIFNDYAENNGEGKVISGYVWEDMANMIMDNNLYLGNGTLDDKEKGIPNVKVELIEVLMDKSTGNELEILKQVGDTYSFRTDKNGAYKFTNLPTGTYKVKFTYGDETQLKQDVTFNGQDYKSVANDTVIQQYQKPSMEVMILTDTSESMTQNGRDKLVNESAKNLIEALYENVQTIKVGAALFSEPNSSDSSICKLTQKPNKNDVLTLFDNIKTNTGTSLEVAIDNAIAQFSTSAANKIIVICTDGYISSNAAAALTRAANAGVKVISIVCSTDEWTINTFGTEASPTTGNLYYIRDNNIPEYITEVALEDILQEVSRTLANIIQAKDVQKAYNVSGDSQVGEIYTRQKNIDYTATMNYVNGSVVDGKDSTNISEFAKNTQMTAITPTKNVMIQHNNNETSNANLGLIERPKVELQIQEELAGVQVKLSSGEVVIDTEKDLTKNVQIIPNSKYNVFLDQEIMQGASLTLKYRITVFNNGHVDTLGQYFDYDMFNSAEVAKYTETVATKVGTIYSYYTNMIFRAEDNSNWAIEKNTVTTDAKITGTNLTNWESYIKNSGVNTPKFKTVEVVKATDGQAETLDQKAMWEDKALVRTGVEQDSRLKDGSVKVVQTNSLNNIKLYPVISKESLSNKGISSVSTYVQFSKTISSSDETDTLVYKQSVEIVERLNDLGRRDYEAVPGNYSPHDKITEYDSAKVEDVIVLNPFGKNMQTYFGIAIGLIAIIGTGVVFIKRKILS